MVTLVARPPESLPPIRQESVRRLPALGPVRRCSVEIMSFTARMSFEEGCIISYDGASAFKSMCHNRFFTPPVKYVPSEVPYTAGLYARELPNLFALGGGGLEVVESARGVQLGYNLDLLCYNEDSLKVVKEFRAKSYVPGARAVSLIDDITIILPPELSLNTTAIVIDDSRIQRIVLATEETMATQRVSHIPMKSQSRSWSPRGAKVSESHHDDNPLLKPTRIEIATKSLPGPSTREHRKLLDVKTMSLCLRVRTAVSIVWSTASRSKSEFEILSDVLPIHQSHQK